VRDLNHYLVLLIAHGIHSMRAPHADEIKISEDVLKRIAEMTGIAAAEYRDAARAIHWALNSVLDDTLMIQSIRALESSRPSIRPVLQAARSLLTALRNLDESARIALQAHVDAFHDAKLGDRYYEIEMEKMEKEDRGEEILDENRRGIIEEYEEMAADLMAAAKNGVEFRLNEPVESVRRELEKKKLVKKEPWRRPEGPPPS
jgi:hypothetical protein